MRVIASLLIAFSTYSRLPVPQAEWTEENRRYVMCFFPLIGAVIGGALWLWLRVCEALAVGALLKGAVGALIPLLVTGGIHMDGFMDTVDALASWQTPEKRLEILKDSRAGAFAVMGCAGYLLVMAALLSEARTRDAAALGASFVLSRAMSAWTMVSFTSARPGGTLDSQRRASDGRLVRLTSAICAIMCAVIWAMWGGWAALPCVFAALCALVCYRRMAYRQFGGVTGDLAGWLTQVAELACVAAVILGGKLL